MKPPLLILLVLGLTLAAAPEASAVPDPGQALVVSGRMEEAIAYYRRVLAREPENMTACAGLGDALCRAGNTAESLETLNRCRQRHPRDAGLYFARGMCRQQQGPSGFDAAMLDFRQVLALDPKNAPAHNQLGIIYQARGNYPAAIEEFQAAIDQDPNLFIAENNLAASLIALKRYPEAIAVLQNAIARAPSLKGLYFYTNLGIAFLYSGMLGQAEAAFLMETAINPDHLEAHINLGNLYVLRGRYDDAFYEFNRVLMADPKNQQALVNLGAAYVMAGNPDESLRYLEPAVELYPDSALAHHYLGQAAQALGDPVRAASEEKRATQLGYQPGVSPFGGR
jgi:tetratricopeptide (TPR) repeat protein